MAFLELNAALEGEDLRDKIAIRAAMTILRSHEDLMRATVWQDLVSPDAEGLAHAAYTIADAMIAERDKRRAARPS